MRYGIVTANLGDYADPRVAVRLARAAEAAGWEAYFVWDHLGFVRGVPSGDPWVILSAVAASTMHLMLGLAITPLARRRPQVVANALASLDLLSGGRVVFGAGLGGDPEEFTAFGEPGDAMRRAAMLDEGVQVLGGLWSGETVTHRGKHYAVGGVSLAPRLLQRPRVPIWIGGVGAPACAGPPAGTVGSLPQRAPTGPRPWPKAPDGSPRWWPKSEGTGPRTHPSRWPSTGTRSPALPRAYGAAGATWWLESIHDVQGTPGEMLARVKAGPPEDE